MFANRPGHHGQAGPHACGAILPVREITAQRQLGRKPMQAETRAQQLVRLGPPATSAVGARGISPGLGQAIDAW
ncbi:MAG: hypothetical protein KDG50_04475 [Chromatiales bacterium]|nr:hypothetical protein [Chromatiales bacterium]